MEEVKFVALGTWYFERLNNLTDQQLTQYDYPRVKIGEDLKKMQLK
ncbi:DUF6483 family protein [Lactiplantibacillus plajomi]|uniref:DUF6483 family protein n=1 Tax=Lactiplantibacillus plajomi TaxID=1457217 RepID=A0ABV6K1D4_9LACO